jgi:hypothetical protein
VLTRPGTTTLASPAATATADVSAFQKMFFVADDTADVTTRLLALVQSVPMGGKQVHDANLVATMQVYLRHAQEWDSDTLGCRSAIRNGPVHIPGSLQAATRAIMAQ